ncbi:hypothetical protein DXG01_002015 [Tephrocybe rancida]|nr:hypothetical protein DXG01_002015 [Tephrocybe rancida]
MSDPLTVNPSSTEPAISELPLDSQLEQEKTPVVPTDSGEPLTINPSSTEPAMSESPGLEQEHTPVAPTESEERPFHLDLVIYRVRYHLSSSDFDVAYRSKLKRYLHWMARVEQLEHECREVHGKLIELDPSLETFHLPTFVSTDPQIEHLCKILKNRDTRFMCAWSRKCASEMRLIDHIQKWYDKMSHEEVIQVIMEAYKAMEELDESEVLRLINDSPDESSEPDDEIFVLMEHDLLRKQEKSSQEPGDEASKSDAEASEPDVEALESDSELFGNDSDGTMSGNESDSTLHGESGGKRRFSDSTEDGLLTSLDYQCKVNVVTDPVVFGGSMMEI